LCCRHGHLIRRPLDFHDAQPLLQLVPVFPLRVHSGFGVCFEASSLCSSLLWRRMTIPWHPASKRRVNPCILNSSFQLVCLGSESFGFTEFIRTVAGVGPSVGLVGGRCLGKVRIALSPSTLRSLFESLLFLFQIICSGLVPSLLIVHASDVGTALLQDLLRLVQSLASHDKPFMCSLESVGKISGVRSVSLQSSISPGDPSPCLSNLLAPTGLMAQPTFCALH